MVFANCTLRTFGRSPNLKDSRTIARIYGVPTAPRKSSSCKVRWVWKRRSFALQWSSGDICQFLGARYMYIQFFYKGTVHKRLGPDYEVTTVWISSSNDFAKLNAAHLFSELRGKYKVTEKHFLSTSYYNEHLCRRNPDACKPFVVRRKKHSRIIHIV